MVIAASGKLGATGWSFVFLLLASAVFFEALHAPTIDDSVIPNLVDSTSSDKGVGTLKI